MSRPGNDTAGAHPEKGQREMTMGAHWTLQGQEASEEQPKLTGGTDEGSVDPRIGVSD